MLYSVSLRKNNGERGYGYAFCRANENGQDRLYRDVRSVLCAGCGAAVHAGVSALWIGRLLGIGLILFGAIKLVGYFSRDLFRLAFQYDLAFGLLLMVLGIVTLSHPGDALSFLCVMFGIPVLADGLFKIQIAMDSRQFGIRNWWLVLVLAALTCVVGVVLVFRPMTGVRALTALMGPVAAVRRRAESQRGAVHGEDRGLPAARCDRNR